jgi:hypothetical protein
MSQQIPHKQLEALTIEAQMDACRIGAFQLWINSRNTLKMHESQRDVDQSNVDLLVASFKRDGINRAPPMLAILSSDSPLKIPHVDNQILRFPDNVPLRIISGQHRVLALRKLIAETNRQEEGWWIVHVYERSK